MSRTVDERVVEMRFDNENFEKNAQQSLSTLEKLKNALSFKGAENGLKNVDAASRSVNMSGLGGAVQTVTSKFLALEIIGVTALVNITNKAINAGEQMLKSLSIDQITAGWEKYADKTTAVQTIMAATASQFSDQATQMAAVNEQLEKLSWFTDETSYNFVDMVSNIGKFTSNNIGLETSVTAMQGIATWAAISGANAGEASRAMYNLSQAIGVGAVTAIDWKSIENANMATAEFKQTAIETAVSLGTLKKVGDDLYETIDGNTVSVANFREALKDKWFTNDVLTATLDKYGAFTTKLNKAYNETGKQTSEILEDIQAYKDGTIDYAKAVEGATVSAEEYEKILSELGDSSMDFGRKAFQAAQEAKTFAEVINYTKDAVSSQWMGIFESIFGDYTQAKKLWTGVAEDFYTLFVEPLEKAGDVIDEAFGSKWDDLTDQIIDAGLSMSDFEEAVKQSAEGGADAVNDLIKEYGSFQAAVASGKLGDAVKNGLSSIIDKALGAKNATDAVTTSVVNLEDVVKRVIRGDFGNGQARVEALTKAGYDYNTVQDLVNKTLWGQKVTYEQLLEVQGASGELTEEQKKKLKELQEQIGDTDTDLEELLRQVQRPSGRELFTETLQNGLQIIIKSIEIVKGAWHDVFPATTAEQIYHFLEVIHGFSEKTLTKLGDNAEKIGRTFKGLFDALDLIIHLIKGGFSLAIRVVNKVLGLFNVNIWDITAAIGDWITHLHDAILGTEEASGVLDTIIETIAKLAQGLVWLLKKAGILDKIKNAISNLGNIAGKAKGKLTDFFKNVGDKIAEFVSHWKDIDKLDLKTFGAMLTDFKKTVIDSFFDFSKEEDKVKNLSNSVGSFFSGFGSGFSLESTPFIEGLVNTFNNAKEYISKKVGFNDIITGLFLGADFYLAKRLMTFLESFTKKIFNFSDSLTNIGNSIAGMFTSISGVFNSISLYFKNLKTVSNLKIILYVAAALGILAAALIALSKVPMEDLDAALIRMAALAGILAALALAIGFMNKLSAGSSGLNAVALVALALSIAILSKVIKSLSELSYAEALRGAVALGEIAIVLVGAMGLFSAVSAITKVGAFSFIGFIAFAIALRIMIDNMVQIQNKLDGLDVGRIRGQLIALAAAFAILAGSSRLFGGWKQGFGMLAAVGSLYLMILVIQKLADLDIDALKNNIGALIAVFGLIAILMAITRLAGENAQKGGAGILMLSISLLIIVGVMGLLADMNPRDLAKGVLVVSILLLVMGAVVALSHFAGSDAIKAGFMILLMSIAIGLMVGSMYLLVTLAKKQEEMKLAIKAIEKMGLIFAALIAVSRLAASSKRAVSMLIVIIAAMAVMVGALYLLSKIENQDGLKQATASMAILMALFGVLEFVSSKAKMTVGSLITIGVLVLVVAALAGLLYLISGLPVESTLPNAEALALLLVALSVSMFVLSKIGAVTPAAALGILELAGILAIIAGVVVTIGGLIAKINGAQEFIDSSIPILASIGEALGSLYGGFIGGLIGAGAVAISESFITVAENLGDAWDELSPVMDDLANLGDKKNAVDGITAISNLLTAFSSSGIKDALGNLLNGILGQSDVKSFGEKLKDFVSIFEDFPEVDDTKVQSAEKMAAAGKALAEFANSIPNEGGFLAKLVGDNFDLSKFGSQIASFAEELVKLPTFGEDITTKAVNIGDAGKALAEFANSVPNEGGFLAKLAGDNFNLGKFGDQIKLFADAIADTPSIGEEIKTSVINAGEAASKIVEVVKNIPSNIYLEELGQQVSLFIQEIASAQTLNEGMLANVDNVVKTINTLMNSITREMGSQTVTNAARDNGKKLLDYFQRGINDYGANPIVSATSKIINTVLTSMRDRYQGFYNAGGYLISGFINGLSDSNAIARVKAAATAAAQAAVDTIEEVGEIGSPSKVTYRLGEFFSQGFTNAIVDYYGVSKTASEGLAHSALDGMAETMSIIGDTVNNSDLELHPSIVPVFDTGSISSDVDKIQNGKTLSLSSSISTQLDANNAVLDYINKLDQANASRSKDVLSKFDKLSSDILSLGDRIENLELRLDGNKLVGGLAEKTDRSVGRRTMLERRRV